MRVCAPESGVEWNGMGLNPWMGRLNQLLSCVGVGEGGSESHAL